MRSPAFRENSPSPIRDAIHNYIRTTKFETFIIDTPEFQRLRDTLQNSTAFLTFPCNTHTRFSHSLGVMHVAGDMFIQALKNSDGEILKYFLKDADTYIKEFANISTEENDDASGTIGFRGNQKLNNKRQITKNTNKKLIDNIKKEWKEELGNASRFSHNPELFSSIEDLDEVINCDFPTNFIINTLWQVVRIGALIHDLGHLPMSHIFEKSIDLAIEGSSGRNINEEAIFNQCIDQKNEMFRNAKNELGTKTDCNRSYDNLYNCEELSSDDNAYHEKLGLYLFSTMFEEKFEGELLNKYSKIIKDMVIEMIGTPAHAISFGEINTETGQCDNKRQNKKYSFLSFLHSIFDNSFIDSDRIDYCRRDPYFSGSELGSFDYERVINSSTLVRQNFEDNERNYVYRLAHNQKSIGALESLLFQRYSIYTNIVYHHSISRMNAVVKKTLQELIHYFNSNEHDSGDDIIKTIKEFKFFSQYRDDENEDRYSFMDERYINTFDESWLKTFFRKILILEEQDGIRVDSDASERIFLLIDTFLSRKIDNLLSVWKSSQECQDQLRCVKPDEFINFSLEFQDEESKIHKIVDDLEKFFNNIGVIFIFDKLKLPSFAENPIVVNKSKSHPLKSNVLKNLSELSKSSLSVNFFLVKRGLKDIKDNKEEDYKDKINGVFLKYLQK